MIDSCVNWMTKRNNRRMNNGRQEISQAIEDI